MSLSASEVSALWRRFRVAKDSKTRDALINHYAYLVKITAGRVVTSLPPNLEREDLISVGVVGLIKAIDQFDPGRQVKFETYAIALIRGAILEMLREEDWVPRSIRDNVKNLEKVYHRLEVAIGRPATEAEVAADLGITVDELQQILVNTSRASVLSLDDVLMGSGGDAGESLHLADVLADDASNTATLVERVERKRILTLGIERLPERERLVIALYYYEGLTFKEIGKVLTVSESRVYQLHTQAVLRIRGYLQRDSALFQSS
ncbi:MAG TPA: FliA/WhiG family RNA polymerase sigma factor [Capsulimonadaceae bacterium]|jgi:RNA polymerase sigma factor for flagellar operon FliA